MNEQLLKSLIEIPDLFFENGFFYFSLPSFESGKVVMRKCPLMAFDDLIEAIDISDIRDLPLEFDAGMKVSYDVFQTYSGNAFVFSARPEVHSFDLSSKRRARASYKKLRSELYSELERKSFSSLLSGLKSVAIYKKISESKTDLGSVDARFLNFAYDLDDRRRVSFRISDSSNPTSEISVELEHGGYNIVARLKEYLVYGHEERKFYRFPTAKVTVKIDRKGDASPPKVSSSLRNPFQSSENLCIVTKNIGGIRGKAERAKMVLSDAIGTVVAGYHPGANPYKHLDDEMYNSIEISKAQAENMFRSGQVFVHPRYHQFL